MRVYHSTIRAQIFKNYFLVGSPAFGTAGLVAAGALLASAPFSGVAGTVGTDVVGTPPGAGGVVGFAAGERQPQLGTANLG